MVRSSRPVTVVSNRGPLSFSREPGGELVARRGGGGLVSSLGPVLRDTGMTWMAAALTDVDREVAEGGATEAEGFRIRYVAVDPDAYRMAYDVVSNATLWFLHHGLFDLSRRPRLDRRWREAWDAYREVNHHFAAAVIEEAPEGATVLVQDYHLALVGTWLAQERSDLRAVHFTHVPFCEPGALRVLPAHAAEELLVGMTSHYSCGFHSRRWAVNFRRCCFDVLGFEPSTFVSPVAPDEEAMLEVAHSEDGTREGARLDEMIGDRKVILRVDRIELSKNLLRGFWAFDELLSEHRELRQRVVFIALGYPSREALPEYLAYRQEVDSLMSLLNDKWSTPGWTPIIWERGDNFARSVAALQRYDVLLVNPIRDGLNLVAKEGALLNRRDGVLALSREAGAWEELSEVAMEVNPFDVADTAEVLAAALALSPEERASRAASLRAVAGARTPRDWMDEQLQAAERES